MASKKKTTKKKTARKSSTPETSAPKWFSQGAEGFQRKATMDVVAKKRKDKAVSRFRLRDGEEGDVVFIDDTGFFINEHNLKLDGRWGNFFTCSKDFSPCGICERGFRPTFTGYFTVIDTREFERQDGTKVKDRKVLYPAKGTAIAKLEELKKKHKTLKGLMFRIKRYSAEESNAGANFELKGRVKDIAKKYGRDATKAIDYMKVFALPTDEEYASLGMVADVIGDDNKTEEVTGGVQTIL